MRSILKNPVLILVVAAFFLLCVRPAAAGYRLTGNGSCPVPAHDSYPTSSALCNSLSGFVQGGGCNVAGCWFDFVYASDCMIPAGTVRDFGANLGTSPQLVEYENCSFTLMTGTCDYVILADGSGREFCSYHTDGSTPNNPGSGAAPITTPYPVGSCAPNCQDTASAAGVASAAGLGTAAAAEKWSGAAGLGQSLTQGAAAAAADAIATAAAAAAANAALNALLALHGQSGVPGTVGGALESTLSGMANNLDAKFKGTGIFSQAGVLSSPSFDGENATANNNGVTELLGGVSGGFSTDRSIFGDLWATWRPPLFTANCQPFVKTVLGSLVVIDLCTYVVMLRDLIGWLFAMFTIWHIYGLVVRGRS